MRIERSLKELGLSQNKQQLYLTILDIGSGTLQDIVLKTGWPRTTVISLIKQLTTDGLIKIIYQHHQRTYQTQHPKKLFEIIEKKKKSLTKVMLDLMSYYHQGAENPIVKFYEGREAAKEVYDDTLKIFPKTYYEFDPMVDVYNGLGQEGMEDYVNRRIQAKINLKVIRSYQPGQKDIWQSNPQQLREVRYANPLFSFPVVILIYDNKVAIADNLDESYGLIIESKDFYNTLKRVFEEIWPYCATRI